MHRPETDNPDDHWTEQPPDKGMRIVWLVWGLVALAAIAILPFSARMDGVVRALAAACGITL